MIINIKLRVQCWHSRNNEYVKDAYRIRLTFIQMSWFFKERLYIYIWKTSTKNTTVDLRDQKTSDSDGNLHSSDTELDLCERKMSSQILYFSVDCPWKLFIFLKMSQQINFPGKMKFLIQVSMIRQLYVTYKNIQDIDPFMCH